MTNIKFKTNKGFVTSMDIGELIEVDGVAFRKTGGDEIAELRGRVETLENIIGQCVEFRDVPMEETETASVAG